MLLLAWLSFLAMPLHADNSGPVRWYLQGAEQGNASSQFQLGQMYLSGEGIEPDFEQARRWLRLSALQDYPAAQFELGEIYRVGHGVPIDYVEAYAWFHLASLNKLTAGLDARNRISLMMDTEQLMAAYWRVKMVWKEMAAGTASSPKQ